MKSFRSVVLITFRRVSRSIFLRSLHLEVKQLQSAALSFWRKTSLSPLQPAMPGNGNDKFYQWFVGFSEAEACFKIKPKNRDGKLHSFYFEFEIHLHIDDLKLLRFICDTLGIGNVYTREKSNSCSFIVGNEEGIRALINIFDCYTFKGIKLLDYLDFKKAFLCYFDRTGTLDDSLKDYLLKIKQGMNKGRIEFSMPKNHQIEITKYWLLGLIEGEGSFSLSKAKLRPNFQLLFTASQKPLLVAIKEYLLSSLDFDRFSLWKLKNSSLIGIYDIMAKGNSKPTVCLEIRSVHLLWNYIIPFLNSMPFISKKGYDFADFLVICNVLYTGRHNNQEIRGLILKLASGMNDFRLSTYKGRSSAVNNILTTGEFALLKDNTLNGVVDTDNLSSNVIYVIIKPNKEEILVASLIEVGNIVGVKSEILSKLLKSLPTVGEEGNISNGIEINKYLVKRVKIFCGR